MPLNPRAFGPGGQGPTSGRGGLMRLARGSSGAVRRPSGRPELGGDARAVSAMRTLPGATPTPAPEPNDAALGVDFARSGPAAGATPAPTRGLTQLAAGDDTRLREFIESNLLRLPFAEAVSQGRLTPEQSRAYHEALSRFNESMNINQGGAVEPVSPGESGSPTAGNTSLGLSLSGLQGLQAAMNFGRVGIPGTSLTTPSLMSLALSQAGPFGGIFGGALRGAVDQGIALHGVPGAYVVNPRTGELHANPEAININEAEGHPQGPISPLSEPSFTARGFGFRAPSFRGGGNDPDPNDPGPVGPVGPTGELGLQTDPTEGNAPDGPAGAGGAVSGAGPSGVDAADPDGGDDGDGYRRGGPIPKRGRRSDPVPITAHEGEFVMDEDSTRAFKPMLGKMNRWEPGMPMRGGLERMARGM